MRYYENKTVFDHNTISWNIAKSIFPVKIIPGYQEIDNYIQNIRYELRQSNTLSLPVLAYYQTNRAIFTNSNFKSKPKRFDFDQFSTYENYNEKGDLRKALLKEPGNICCYCMQRIKTKQKDSLKDKMKIVNH